MSILFKVIKLYQRLKFVQILTSCHPKIRFVECLSWVAALQAQVYTFNIQEEDLGSRGANKWSHNRSYIHDTLGTKDGQTHYSTLQYSTVQSSTVQYITVQYSTRAEREEKLKVGRKVWKIGLPLLNCKHIYIYFQITCPGYPLVGII